MANTEQLWKPGTQATAANVTLQVYDFLEQGFNGLLRQVGTGGFHCAVEIFSKEWSFRRTLMGTGVYWIHPKTCTAHKFRESVPMGKVVISEEKFLRIMGRLKKEWPGSTYDILRRNCCAFSNELCKELGVGPIPDWITNLSTVGADLRSMVRRPLRQMEAAMSPDALPVADPRKPGKSPANRERSPKPNRGAYEKMRPTPRKSEDNIEVSIPRVGLWKCFISALVLATVTVICCIVAVVLARFDVSWVDIVTLPGTGIPSGQQTVPGGAAARFNCSEAYVTWQLDWSLRKQRWCCAHTGRACPPANRHDCQATVVQVKAWSEDKRRYCCNHENYGCPSTYNCVARRSSRLGWDGKKREWCCKHKGVGCSSLHNCTSANATQVAGWSSVKLDWCCEHKNTGCITNKSSGKSAEHDCRAADASEVASWPKEKKAWCCKHDKVGCFAHSNASEHDAVAVLPPANSSLSKTSPGNDASQDATVSALTPFEIPVPPSASHSASRGVKNGGSNRSSGSSSSSSRSSNGSSKGTSQRSNSATPRNSNSSHHSSPRHDHSNSSGGSAGSSSSSSNSSAAQSTSKHGRPDAVAHSMLHSSEIASSSTKDAAVSSGTSSSSTHLASAGETRAAEEPYLHTQGPGESAILPKQKSSHPGRASG
eukprot:CAMPEP_0172785164 /NCGR_PEP_ID=MMETSP1074-20121228/205304_1 /TAXON_ID=2916 /ORGANISM="Ceratium fusus, Strain PA161109" /LENGTH=652 /DNA_ID=CAMNT_0013622167 /DNA_START=52 /DNA_END=2013 /DNA_ORIENTATION=+